MATEYSFLLMGKNEGATDVADIPTMNVEAWHELMANLRKVAYQALTWEKLGLSLRARNALTGAKLSNAWDLLALSRQQVERIPKAGAKVRGEVYAVLKGEVGVLMENWRD